MKNEPKYYIIGFEFNNHWKAATIYAGKSNEGDLIQVDEIKDGLVYTEPVAEKIREYLQRDFSDLTWYLMKVNLNTNA